jgi:hypothetical protein
MAAPKFQNLQKDPAELEKCKKDPVYFYNMYIRKEGEKVLDEKEYKQLVANNVRFRNHPPGIIDAMLTQVENYEETMRSINNEMNKDANTGTQ